MCAHKLKEKEKVNIVSFFKKSPLLNNVTIQKVMGYIRASETEKGNKIIFVFSFMVDE